MGETVGWPSDRIHPTRVRIFLLSIGFTFLLGVVFLTQVTHPPAFVTGWRVAMIFVLFGIFAMSLHALTTDVEASWYPFAVALLGGFVLLEGLYRYQIPEFGPEGPNILLFVLVFLALFSLLLYPDPRALRGVEWSFVGAFAVVAGLFFYHTYATNPSPTWPIWAAIVAGVAILVVPRTVPDVAYLWPLSGLAALTAVAAIVSFRYGEYTLPFASVERWSQTFPITDHEVDGLYGHTSIFNNVNVFGLVAFAGLTAAAILLHRAARAGSALAATPATLLLLLNATGLVLSNSGAAWTAAFATGGFYGAYILFGRKAIPPVLGLGVLIAVSVTWVTYTGRLRLDDSGRFDHWEAGIRAFRNNPSTWGHGHISTADFTAAYLERDPNEPHNSYLDMLIRIGVVGTLAYLVLLLGVVLDGVVRYRTVDVGMLAFGLGWAVHHLFESYTMFQWTIPAVLSALTIGYLLFGQR